MASHAIGNFLRTIPSALQATEQGLKHLVAATVAPVSQAFPATAGLSPVVSLSPADSRQASPVFRSGFPLRHKIATKVFQAAIFTNFLGSAWHYARGVTRPIDALTAAFRTTAALDFQVSAVEQLKPTSAGAFFGREFLREFQREDFQAFMQAAMRALGALPSAPKTNLWELAFKSAGQNHEKALLWMALLNQGAGVVTINFLTRYLPPSYEAAIERFAVVMSQSRNSPILDLYPVPVTIQNERMYHYYTVAYLTAKSAREHPDSKLGAFLPFGINTSYEFYTDHGHFEKITKWFQENKSLRILFHILTEPLRDVPAYQAGEYVESEKDVYLGYAAHMLATGRQGQTLSFEDFNAQFSKDPEGFMQNLRELS